MSHRLSFAELLCSLCETLERIPEHRLGTNKQYTLQDAGLAAFSVFHMQSPSFLAHQRTMQQAKGRSNAQSIFGMKEIPCDNQIRVLLDPVDPCFLNPVYGEAVRGLEEAGWLEKFRSFHDGLLVALDGTWYFSSQKIHCDNCNHRTNPDNTTTYFHAAITPVIVKAGDKHVIPLEPEFIWPQDGHEKQDCEQEAAKRWINTHAERLKTWKVTILGDDLLSRQPFCSLLLEKQLNFVLVCKPDSHSELYRWIDYLDTQGAVDRLSLRCWNGRSAEIYHYRYLNQVPLCIGEEAPKLNWCELTITAEETGEILYRNSWITNFTITETTVQDIVRDGRARWKIENENNNVLKTKGYHLEHNFGHGQQFLSAILVSLNLLAFLFHTIFDLVDPKYQLLRNTLASRKTFFNDIRALTRYLLFQDWDHLLDFMITQLELLPP
jgi:hypothetical protein